MVDLVKRFDIAAIDIFVTDDAFVRIDIHNGDHGTVTLDLLPSQVTDLVYELAGAGNRATEKRWGFAATSPDPTE